ncbi:MAG: protein-disulfide reductase DsbD family protein, partial [Acidiferrobacterales bacterium]|nr:protein-disulfide reductase DsbD family protein [Acidiferrobacterales bacterium]
PHFEKMLYDNAQLLKLYAGAYETTAKPLYRYIAEDVAAYLIDEMMSPQGAFYTAQDAQVDGIEGVSYRWKEEEIERILGAHAAETFFRAYELTPFPEVSGATGADAGDVGGVLRVRQPVATTLRDAGFDDPAAMMAALKPMRQKLLEVRNKRPQPLRDEKLNVDLNGLAIDAFVASARVLGKPRHLNLAQRAAVWIWMHAYDPATGHLMHEIFRGRAQTEGFLADYALFGRGLMALYDATGNGVWRTRAAALADGIIKRFAGADGQLTMTAGEAELLTPIESAGDRTYPSGTSAAIDLFLRLGETKGGEPYAAVAVKILHYYSGRMERYPEMWATAVAATNRADVSRMIKIASTGSATGPAGPKPLEYKLPKTADHVQASAQARATEDEPAIVVTLTVAKGYHVNANPASFEYLIPTSVSFDGISAARVTYPDAVPFKPSFTDETLKVYEGTPVITATFPRGTLDNLSVIRGSVKVQACNDQICLPPSELEISADVSGQGVRAAK